jgi:ribulose-phosphate 3-epimerase
MNDIDLVLVMSVDPGFGGQEFIPATLDKLRAVRKRIDATKRAIDLEVDGGINPETARAAISAGADVLVAGSATFAGNKSAYAGNIQRLRGEGAGRLAG